MVRVVSQNFSPPRSRHSSGETDRDLAERASLALSVHGRKRVDTPDFESSSDSYWDSELDGDQCDVGGCELGMAANDINGNETPEKSDVQSRRKERRRERNKLSAQAYRLRRRSENVKAQHTLMELETKNKELHTIVETLEKETEHVKHLLRECSSVDVRQPIGELEGATADISDMDAGQHNPRSVIPGHSHTSRSSLSAVNFLHSDPNPTLPLPSFPQKPPHSPAFKDPLQQMPMMGANIVPDFTCSTSSRPNPALRPALAPNFIFNTNILVDATASTSGVDMPTAVSTLLVPVESHSQAYPSSNLNCNLMRKYSPAGHSTVDAAQSISPDSAASHSNPPPPAEQYPVINAIWWNRTQMKPTLGPVTGTLVGLVNMGLCNSNNMNNSSVGVDDTNGNNNCDKNVNFQNHPNSQHMSFNLNQAADPTGQEALCQNQFSVKYPAELVQYFLASGDQISVQ